MSRFFCILGVIAIVLPGCTSAPSEDTVQDILKEHFEVGRYRVVEVDIAEVSSIPLSSKTYMGTEGYHVRVRSLVLQASEDIGPPWNYAKGQRIRFDDAEVWVRRAAGAQGREGKWLVTNVSGINVVP